MDIPLHQHQSDDHYCSACDEAMYEIWEQEHDQEIIWPSYTEMDLDTEHYFRFDWISRPEPDAVKRDKHYTEEMDKD